MKFADLVKMYGEKKRQYGAKAYLRISEMLAEAKARHIQDYIEAQLQKGRSRDEIDPEQSWRAFKGKNFEKLVLYIIEDSVKAMGLKSTKDNALNRRRLSRELSEVRRRLVVHYGKYDFIPDTDIVIYNPGTYRIIAVVSCKITLRERIAQTAYWKLKLLGDPVTSPIKVFFVTPDEDGHLITKKPPSKGRAIVECDLDGTYVLRNIEESKKVKMFDKFLDDLKEAMRDV